MEHFVQILEIHEALMSGPGLRARGGDFSQITRSASQQADIIPDMTCNLHLFRVCLLYKDFWYIFCFICILVKMILRMSVGNANAGNGLVNHEPWDFSFQCQR